MVLTQNTEFSLIWKGRTLNCAYYDESHLPAILNRLFFWKTSVLLAEQTNTKKPQLPGTFSEPFCCLVCGLAHNKLGTGPDAFRLTTTGNIEAAVEIKAMITSHGFTDIKRDLNFDELYWLSLEKHHHLRYKIYRFHNEQIGSFVARSNTKRDRGTGSLQNIAEALQLSPLYSGHIGIIRDD
jgi:hypothetical protein